MGLLQQAGDLIWTYRFVKLLSMRWQDTDAFKLGIVDDEGRLLRGVSQLKTEKERAAYTPFIRLVFNVKRILQKVPGGSSRLSSYAAALWLIQEETGMSEEAIARVLRETVNRDGFMVSEERSWNLSENGSLRQGTYVLSEDALLLEGFEPLAMAGTRVDVPRELEPAGKILGESVFRARHRFTRRDCLVAAKQLISQ